MSVTPKNAKKGSDVTITATPDKGYEVGDIVAKDAKGNKLTLKDNGDGTYTFTMPASKVTVTAAFAEKKAEPIAPEKLFADVSAEEYYYEAVKWASENGVTGGIGENLFGCKAALHQSADCHLPVACGRLSRTEGHERLC